MPAYTKENNVDLEVWDQTISFLAERGFNTVLIDLGDAVQYESHPEIAAPDAWSKEFLRKKLDEIRALGMTPIPKLNFSTAHDTWLGEYGRMVSTSTYRRVCTDLIDEVCELFDSPALFHLGMDEEQHKWQENHAISIVRSATRWWEDFAVLCQACEENGARPWIWSSVLMADPARMDRMPKSVLLSAYTGYSSLTREIYNKADSEVGGGMSKARFCEEMAAHGFDVVQLTSAWNFYNQPLQCVSFAKERYPAERLAGFLAAPWVVTADHWRYALQKDADHLYRARRQLYPETLPQSDNNTKGGVKQ